MSVSYQECRMCPRQCGADRRVGSDSGFQRGFCGESEIAYLAWSGLHKGEEPPVSGENGSGMFFFRGCSLGCPTCQNRQISSGLRPMSAASGGMGNVTCLEADAETLCELAWDLRGMGAHSISFVTAEHFTPLVVEVCRRLRQSGFDLPFVHNTSGWISADAIDELIPYIDIWLWDCKTHDAAVAAEFFGSSGYADAERESFAHLIEKASAFYLPSGFKPEIIVRHLMVPDHVDSTIGVIRDFAPYKDRCMFSLMTQYMDVGDVSGDADGSGLSSDSHSGVSAKDIRRAKRAMSTFGIERGWIQDKCDNELVWMPDFSRENPFPEAFAVASPFFLRRIRNICQMKK